MLTILVSITLGLLCHFYIKHNRNRQIKPANRKSQRRNRNEESESNKSDEDSEDGRIFNYTETVYDLNGRKNYVQKQKRTNEKTSDELSVIDEFSPVQKNQIKSTKNSPILQTRQNYSNFKRRDLPSRRLPNSIQIGTSDYENENPRRSVIASLKNVFSNKTKKNDIEVAKQIRRPSPDLF